MHLDTRGLVALWREGLLAKAVIENKTKGYKNHPQLIRFQAHNQPRTAIVQYLHVVLAESRERGFNFNATKLPTSTEIEPISETSGQLAYEWNHLLEKLARRSPETHRLNLMVKASAHPLFKIVPGAVQPWERVTGKDSL